VTSQSGSPRRIDGESVLVLCFVVFTTLYLYQTLSFERTLMSDFVGPSAFPQLVAGIGLVLAVIYFLQLRFSKTRSPTNSAEAEGFLAQMAPLLPVVPIVFYVLILEPLGFLFATVIYVFVAMLLFGQALVKSLIYAFTMSTAFFIIFYYVLLTQVPMGWLIETGRVLPFLVQIRRAIEG